MVGSLVEEGQQEGIIKEYKETLGDDRYVHYFDVEMVLWMHAYVKTYKIVLFKCMQFILCQLYLNLKKEKNSFTGFTSAHCHLNFILNL